MWECATGQGSPVDKFELCSEGKCGLLEKDTLSHAFPCGAYSPPMKLAVSTLEACLTTWYMEIRPFVWEGRHLAYVVYSYGVTEGARIGYSSAMNTEVPF